MNGIHIVLVFISADLEVPENALSINLVGNLANKNPRYCRRRENSRCVAVSADYRRKSVLRKSNDYRKADSRAAVDSFLEKPRNSVNEFNIIDCSGGNEQNRIDNAHCG